jgi:hypothetical protein
VLVGAVSAVLHEVAFPGSRNGFPIAANKLPFTFAFAFAFAFTLTLTFAFTLTFTFALTFALTFASPPRITSARTAVRGDQHERQQK